MHYLTTGMDGVFSMENSGPPAAGSIEAGEIMAMHYQYALIAEYRRLLGELSNGQDNIFNNVSPIRLSI